MYECEQKENSRENVIFHIYILKRVIAIDEGINDCTAHNLALNS